MCLTLRRCAFTLVELLVVIAILAVCSGLVLAGVHRARLAAAESKCANNLRQIGLALHQFHDSNGAFPPGVSVQNGKAEMPFLGWSARLLPYLEQSSMWQSTTAAFVKDRVFWTAPHELVRSQVMPVFSCPLDWRLDRSYPVSIGRAEIALTSYLGVEGLNQQSRDGIVFMDSKVRFADIRDGSSNTLIVGERPPSADLDFGWWYAGWGLKKNGTADLSLGMRAQASGRLGRCSQEFIHYQPGAINKNCDALHFWSLHPGGANFAFADGSVRFLSYAADAIMPALASRAGGEVFEMPE